MRLTMRERRSVAKVMAARYRKATKKENGEMLDELIALTGYNRRYAIGLLCGQGKAIMVGRRVRLVGELGRSLLHASPASGWKIPWRQGCTKHARRCT